MILFSIPPFFGLPPSRIFRIKFFPPRRWTQIVKGFPPDLHPRSYEIVVIIPFPTQISSCFGPRSPSPEDLEVNPDGVVPLAIFHHGALLLSFPSFLRLRTPSPDQTELRSLKRFSALAPDEGFTFPLRRVFLFFPGNPYRRSTRPQFRRLFTPLEYSSPPSPGPPFGIEQSFDKSFAAPGDRFPVLTPLIRFFPLQAARIFPPKVTLVSPCRLSGTVFFPTAVPFPLPFRFPLPKPFRTSIAK